MTLSPPPTLAPEHGSRLGSSFCSVFFRWDTWQRRLTLAGQVACPLVASVTFFLLLSPDSQRSGSSPYPLLGSPRAHSLLNISPLVHTPHPSLPPQTHHGQGWIHHTFAVPALNHGRPRGRAAPPGLLLSPLHPCPQDSSASFTPHI